MFSVNEYGIRGGSQLIVDILKFWKNNYLFSHGKNNFDPSPQAS